MLTLPSPSKSPLLLFNRKSHVIWGFKVGLIVLLVIPAPFVGRGLEG
uniref:Uncharacterized protein n=1 Tax=Anguilla anguilla TaxID=7936 RepID=A0A0E9T323_ANGAN